MRYIKSIFFMAILCGVFGCGSKSSDPTPTPPPVVPPTQTTKAVLIAPAKDEVCTTGLPFTSQMNKITFKWKASDLAKDYTITVKNLVTSELTSGTTISTQIELVLAKNVAYSWSVSTKSSINASSLESDVWRFYNVGEATSSFAPYPADLTAPYMDARINLVNGNTTLLWNGSDPDFDIVNYDIYFGTATNPPLFKSDHAGNTFSVAITSGNTYYWKIVTKDRLGNKSESSVFRFTVL